MSDAYKQAGVDIAAGNEAVERMKKHVQKTFRPEVLTGLGGFGGLFGLDKSKYEEPVLVSGTDGVGTKLKLAFAADKHDTIGVDAVAMCVNDIVVSGAEPLFFLDYLATGKIEPAKIELIVKGIADGCAESGCALIGGETAEMPGMYQDGEYDIAGFTVGIVDKPRIIDGSTIQPGDAVIGFASSGFHSNGYSLVRRRLLEQYKLDLHAPSPTDAARSLADVLLTPTKLYVKPILSLLQSYTIKGMAHITGGGFLENIPRTLPENTNAAIDFGSWPIHKEFELVRNGQPYGLDTISYEDMFRTFNMGIGMVLIVPQADADAFIDAANKLGERAYRIGEITPGSKEVEMRGVQL